MIGRSFQIKDWNVYKCFFGGHINFGDIIVIWKNPIDND